MSSRSGGTGKGKSTDNRRDLRRRTGRGEKLRASVFGRTGRLTVEALEDRRVLTSMVMGTEELGSVPRTVGGLPAESAQLAACSDIGVSKSYEYSAPVSYEYAGPNDVNLHRPGPSIDPVTEFQGNVPASPRLPESVSATMGTNGEVAFFGDVGNRNDVVFTIVAGGGLQHNLSGRFGFASPEDLDSAVPGVQPLQISEIHGLTYLDRDAAADDAVTLDAGGWDLGEGSVAISSGTITIVGRIKGREVTLHSAGLTNIAAGAALVAEDGQNGGRIEIVAEVLVQTGELHADGSSGGAVRITADRVVSSAAITANGHADVGGQVEIGFGTNYVGTVGALVSADGAWRGGRVRIGGDSGRLFTSGTVTASGSNASASGGVIELVGSELVLIGATADASGPVAGGRILVGGCPHGRDSAVANARTVEISGVTLRAAGQTGGAIVVWSNEATTFGGSLSTFGRIGGTIEVSSKGELLYAGTADAGPAGTLLLDPKNLTVDAVSGVFPQFNLVNPTPSATDYFGRRITPLSTGNIVVTAPGDNTVAVGAGAAYLYNG